MIKKMLSLLTIMILGVVLSSIAFAQYTIDEVEIDDDEIFTSGANTIFDVERGDELEVKVHITIDDDLGPGVDEVEDLQIEAALRGFDSDETIDDITPTFDAKAGVTYVKKLTLPLRTKLDQDQYKLRIRVADRDSPTLEQTYELNIEVSRHEVEIRDVFISPNNEVDAGRALLGTVRLRNRGQQDEEGVKVVMSIPELGVSAVDFIDELEKEDDDDDEATTEEMFLRIPDDAKTGQYTVRIEAFFDEGDKKNVAETTIFVVGKDAGSMEEEDGKDKTIITVAVDRQAATQGGNEVAYPITLTNAGSTSKTYTVQADGAAFANFRISPTNVMVIESGDSKAFTVFLSADEDAPVGDQTFMVTVSSNGNILKQLPLSVAVQGDADGDSSVRKSLEVGLVVLVILLVIIGLIIGFSKLRGDDEDDDADEKTYY